MWKLFPRDSLTLNFKHTPVPLPLLKGTGVTARMPRSLLMPLKKGGRLRRAKHWFSADAWRLVDYGRTKTFCYSKRGPRFELCNFL